MKPAFRVGLVLIVFPLLLAIGFYSYLLNAPRNTPVGQPALVALSVENSALLADRFNSNTGATRVLIMLSPS